jgi:hypothetical protein
VFLREGTAMPSGIPVVILLARERAKSFFRCVEILHDAVTGEPPPEVFYEGLRVVKHFAWHELVRVDINMPLTSIDNLLRWAYSAPRPSVTALREARTALEETAENWENAVLKIDEMEHSLGDHHFRYREWAHEMKNLITSESFRIRQALRDSWPVDSEKEEQKALAEVRGGGMGLDEAFAKITGVSEDEWRRRVEEHKKRK